MTFLLSFVAACGASSPAPPGPASDPASDPSTATRSAPAAAAEGTEPRTEPDSANDQESPMSAHSDETTAPAANATPRTELATFGAGCFWCVEAVYEQLEGVRSAESGYMGGTVDRPTYEQVCTKKTGHVEVVQVEFDPTVISYATLVDWFWRLHDPTSWDRQGADTGPQYRSVIFFHSPEQERVARESQAAAQPSFEQPIVTELRAAMTFWPAEAEHQGFYFDNLRHGYCRQVIAPKLKKLGLEDGH